MKTRKFLNVMALFAIIAILALPLVGCKEDEPDPPPPQEYPQKQPDTPRPLSFEYPCTVTIKSDDQFTATEWKTLCDKVVAALERGYEAAPNQGAKNSIGLYFVNNTVSAVLLKSATYNVELKNTVPKTMYFKANGNAIDGISGSDLLSALTYLLGGESYPPSP